MKLKYTFETVNMNNEIIAVPVGEGAADIRGVLKLNRTGKEIMEIIKDDISEVEIINQLAKKYENNIEEITEYVHRTIETFRNVGLIDD